MLKCRSNFLGGEHDYNTARFLKSLKELKELHSQVNYAADHYETAFMKGKEKKQVMDDTKEYICRTLITVVDHVGSVSANLDCAVRNSEKFTEVELRISNFTQRVLSHEHNHYSFVMSKFRLRGDSPRLFPRYISHCISVPKSNVGEEPSKIFCTSTYKEEVTVEVEMEEELPLFMYTAAATSISKLLLPPLLENQNPPTASEDTDLKKGNEKLCSSSTTVVPVRDALLAPSEETRKVAFHFQSVRKNGRKWLSMQEKEMSSILHRRSKLRELI